MHLLILLLAFANAVTFTPTGLKQTSFSYKDVCEFSGYKDSLLIESNGAYVLDCMTKRVDLFVFCEKKLAVKDRLLRGVALEDKRVVLCEEAETAILNIDCVGEYDRYCKKPKESCEKLLNKFAHQHELTHSSVTNERGLRLNCYYASKKPL